MRVKFQATEVVRLEVPEAERAIELYLHQTDRIMGAIADPELTEQIRAEVFCLKMQPINFLELYEFQPIVTLKVWCDRQHVVHLRNLDYRIKGLEAFMEGFKLDVRGTLQAVPGAEGKMELQGQADLVVSLELPPPLWLTPKSLLQGTGDRLLSEVLQRIKRQLLKQLLLDYKNWAATDPNNAA